MSLLPGHSVVAQRIQGVGQSIVDQGLIGPCRRSGMLPVPLQHAHLHFPPSQGFAKFRSRIGGMAGLEQIHAIHKMSRGELRRYVQGQPVMDHGGKRLA